MSTNTIQSIRSARTTVYEYLSPLWPLFFHMHMFLRVIPLTGSIRSLACMSFFTPSIIKKQVATRSQSLCVISVSGKIVKLCLNDCQDCLTLSRSLCFSFTDGLFLGGSLAAKDKLQMKRLGITHILNLVGYGLYEVIYCYSPPIPTSCILILLLACEVHIAYTQTLPHHSRKLTTLCLCSFSGWVVEKTAISRTNSNI